jgi:hypothetical protein
MLRTVMIAAALALGTTAALPALAQGAPTAPANRGYSIEVTTIGELLDDAEAKAIVDRHLPGFSTNPQVEMARGFTLKAVQAFAPDQLTDERLNAIQADLAKLPPKA